MIIRVFTATVSPELHQEFEEKFRAISVPLVESFQGLDSVEIGAPTAWNPNQFVMISKWQSEKHLIVFAGEQWNQAHIPKGMEKYISDCSVSHFYSIDLN